MSRSDDAGAWLQCCIRAPSNLTTFVHWLGGRKPHHKNGGRKVAQKNATKQVKPHSGASLLPSCFSGPISGPKNHNKSTAPQKLSRTTQSMAKFKAASRGHHMTWGHKRRRSERPAKGTRTGRQSMITPQISHQCNQPHATPSIHKRCGSVHTPMTTNIQLPSRPPKHPSRPS